MLANLIRPITAKTRNCSGKEHVQVCQNRICNVDVEPTISRSSFPFRHCSHVAVRHLECNFSKKELQVVYFRLDNAKADGPLYTRPLEEQHICCTPVLKLKSIIISLVKKFGFCLQSFSSFGSILILTVRAIQAKDRNSREPAKAYPELSVFEH